jgi:formate-dependent nitrite reductase membrane component NrfD
VIGLGAFYVQAGRVTPPAFWMTLPLGVIIFSLLCVNEIPDFTEDVRGGKRNLVARCGQRAGAVLYVLHPDGRVGQMFLVVSLLGTAILIIYKGNVYAASKGVPFWNSPVLPILYATYAIRAGLAFLLVALPFTGSRLEAEHIGIIELWVAVSAAVMLGFYLGVMRKTNLAACRSVVELTRGRATGAFYLGTVGAGLVVPILLGIVGFGSPLSQAGLTLVGVCSLIGDFFAKYTIAKAGIYRPFVPAG